MAVGIQFYRNRNEKNLINSEETEKFTLLVNNLFDSLNRKFPAEGIRKNSKDLKVFLYIEQISMFIDLFACDCVVCFMFDFNLVDVVIF